MDQRRHSQPLQCPRKPPGHKCWQDRATRRGAAPTSCLYRYVTIWCHVSVDMDTVICIHAIIKWKFTGVNSGINSWHPFSQLLLTIEHIWCCLGWCRSHESCAVPFKINVIFSDESCFFSQSCVLSYASVDKEVDGPILHLLVIQTFCLKNLHTAKNKILKSVISSNYKFHLLSGESASFLTWYIT